MDTYGIFIKDGINYSHDIAKSISYDNSTSNLNASDVQDAIDEITSTGVFGVKGNSETTYRTGNVNITKANIGLSNVGNFKAVSTVANQGLTDTEKTNARTNIGAGTVNTVSTGAGLTGGDITTTGTIKVDIKSETVSTLTAANKGTTSNREYAVGLDANSDLSVNIPWTDTKVTSVGNHYAPTEDASATLSADASGGDAATWGTTSMVTGVDLKRDAKGHVVGITVDSIKMPANPDTDTKVTQTATTTDAAYEVLFSGTADNTSRAEVSRKNSNLTFNPNTGRLQSSILKLYREGTTDQNYPASIEFAVKDTTTGKTYSSAYINAYQDHASTTYGTNLVINPGGNLFIGSGEAPGNHYALYTSSTTENTFVTADGTIYLQANGNTIANRVGAAIDTSGNIIPSKADTATNNIGSIGTSAYKWANGYFININGVALGDSPKFTDTTYDVVSKTANGLVPKLPNETTITKFLRQDGTWNAPVGTTYTGTGLISINSSNVISTTAEVNQNAFSNIKVGSTTVAADAKTDTVEFATSGILTITGDSTNDKVTFGVSTGTTSATAAAGNHTHGLTIAANTGTSSLNMTANTIYKITAGGSEFIFKTPADGNADTKVTVTETNPSSYTSYFPTWYSAVSGTGGVNANNGFKYGTLEGTSASIGRACLTLGNGTVTGNAGNKRGEIYLFSQNQGYARILATAATTAERIIYFPDDAGTVALTKNIPGAATTAAAGLMSAADKTKLNGVATGAEVNQNAFSNIKVGSTTAAADAKTDTVEFVGDGILTVTADATNDKITFGVSTGTTSATAAAGNHTHSAATTAAAGFMSAADKIKLNGVATGAEVNQNAFSNIVVGSTTVAADAKTDNVTFASSGILTVTADATNDKITFGVSTGTTSATAAAGNHDHGNTTIAADSGTSSLNMSANTKYKITAAGKSYVFTTPKDTTYSAATTAEAGLMSAADKTKLNGVATGAEVNQNAFSNIVVGSTTVAADAKTDSVTFASSGILTITGDATNDKITFGVSTGTTSATAAAGNHTHSAATTAAAGFMSAADKIKLNGVETGAQVNTVTGVKGARESSYRTGQINITSANVGALPNQIFTTVCSSLADVVHLMDDAPSNRAFFGRCNIDDSAGLRWRSWTDLVLMSQNVPGSQSAIDYGLGGFGLIFPPANWRYNGIDVGVNNNLGFFTINGGTDSSYTVGKTGYIPMAEFYLDGKGSYMHFTPGGSEISSRPNLSRMSFYIIAPPSEQGVYLTTTEYAPIVSNTMSLGTSDGKWTTVYATNGTINTSDRNLKRDIFDLDNKAKEFIMDLKPVSYKRKDGERTHYGLISQDVEDTMSKMNMTAMDFAGFCKDQKMEKYETDTVMKITEDGKEIKETASRPIEGEYEYGLRYEEFIAPLIKTVQLQQEEINALKEEIKLLKEKL